MTKGESGHSGRFKDGDQIKESQIHPHPLPHPQYPYCSG